MVEGPQYPAAHRANSCSGAPLDLYRIGTSCWASRTKQGLVLFASKTQRQADGSIPGTRWLHRQLRHCESFRPPACTSCKVTKPTMTVMKRSDSPKGIRPRRARRIMHREVSQQARPPRHRSLGTGGPPPGLESRHQRSPGASYFELVDLLQSQAAHADSDCRELFRRVVFCILIHNTDDHLRNHGFILNPKGIALSPAFDVNAAMERNELALAINELESTCDVEIALEAHPAYGLTSAEAKNIISNTREAVPTWRSEATRLRIPKAEREWMAKAFSSKATH